ncbi:MAG: lipopolysaccharide heptosyltransferase II [Candidatus Omnitrophica bacterium]|nr:lipopolysaccharide heptosyltransferase II [Candidatus Omnitrophota bacterium]
MTAPSRILVFELNWLGDILFSFPLLRALRKACPEAYIACTVVPRYVDLLVNNPWINYVHALSDTNRLTSLGEKMAFIRMIRREGYDTCFLLKPSRTKALMASLAGISQRIGFAGKGGALTRVVDRPDDGIHRADQLLALAGAVGITEADGTYEYFLSDEDAERAGEILHEVGGGLRRMVALNPGGNWIAKRWPREYFEKVASSLLERFSDLEVMVTGAGKDRDLAEQIVRNVGGDRCYSVAGRTGLNELAALFGKCELVISADSGPLHLASATGVTTVGIYGPTSAKITGPRGRGRNIVLAKHVDCDIPCYVKECCRDYECMKKVKPEEVFEVSAGILSGK